MMKVHELKIEKDYLRNLMSGGKTAEIRYNDRDYQKGDVLQFYNPWNKGVGTPDFWLHYEITHIHSGLGMADGYVCLSLKRKKVK